MVGQRMMMEAVPTPELVHAGNPRRGVDKLAKN